MISIKGIGAILIVSGCSGVGFSIALNSRREVRLLKELIRAITYMENALQYNLCPLPELCRQAANAVSGTVQEVFTNLSRELDWQIAPDAYSCMCEALSKSHTLPPRLKPYFLRLGRSLGQFDIPGQIRELEGIQTSCEQELHILSTNQSSRLRSYQTLGICIGIVLAILFI